MAKITDILNRSRIFSYSFEVTPDIPEEEINNLNVEPSFFSVTWHAKIHQNEHLDIGPLRIAKFLRSKEKDVLLHLSCDLLKKEFLLRVLLLLQKINVRNLLIILGEYYNPETSDFKDSSELIKCVREHTGSYFCIGIAGLPNCNDDKLMTLKEKVRVGADFILTQAFFEANIYNTFVHRCAKIGIKVPIIPGIFYFETYTAFSGFINKCDIKVSENILGYIKNNPSQEIIGRDIVKQLILDIKGEKFYHFHFFTMNKLGVICDFLY
ncbi:5,10-methylenetetrahydrofolate reductase-like, partial [Achroia grisella]|uniref:5,10-methylenetetrahydrofolate reductase-like n=1 Tax=Achroia grisella TaxID=688607 RepID=UPI0027D23631